jgi:hypothetical protein
MLSELTASEKGLDSRWVFSDGALRLRWHVTPQREHKFSSRDIAAA